VPGDPPLITTAELYDPSTGSFTSTGRLLTGRVGFNATLLANGKVLITGGVSASTESCDVIGDGELYDPETGVFTAAGAYAGTLANLKTGICGFDSTSTLLPDSTVLFATEPAAQVYDPVTATFSLKGAMLVTFLENPFAPDYISGQTANLLLNGKVLMAGGEQEDTGRYNTALLYDATSGLLVPTGNMLRPRGDGHTATLLPDGRVLITGGDSQMCDANNYCYYSGTESSAELYDPVNGVFSGAGNMMASRQGHTATLLNTGDVLITGGAAQDGITPGVPFGGPGGQTGGTNYGSTAEAELYHPASPASPPALFSLSGDGHGQGAIWNPITGQLASLQTQAAAGDVLSMYVQGLAEGGAIPPQVSIGGRLAQILYFGDAPAYPGYYQVNFRVPSGVTPGPAVPVHLTYLGRPSNEVTIAVQ